MDLRKRFLALVQNQMPLLFLTIAVSSVSVVETSWLIASTLVYPAQSLRYSSFRCKLLFAYGVRRSSLLVKLIVCFVWRSFIGSQSVTVWMRHSRLSPSLFFFSLLLNLYSTSDIVESILKVCSIFRERYLTRRQPSGQKAFFKNKL